ncbi:hypothetical protein FSARC_6332 [Fusarium sarcochroum]|uniref:Uncharacterized protein n=1 Tax=Fusarium sarcochroum TaxID=1208366 RepID=A0A8H4TXR1_9HYPO|nr:hypothetical protein FSARC_6332 [Fusarium sarcochroum]
MGLLAKLGHSQPSSIPDEPPPSYDESQSKYQNPHPPPAAEASSSSTQPPPPAAAAAGPSQPPSIPRQFPPAFNLYHQGWPNNCYTLGEHQTHPLYLYSVHTGLSDVPPVLLHSGPDETYPPLASARFLFMNPAFDVELPPVPGSQAPLARESVEPAEMGLERPSSGGAQEVMQ